MEVECFCGLRSDHLPLNPDDSRRFRLQITIPPSPKPGLVAAWGANDAACRNGCGFEIGSHRAILFAHTLRLVKGLCVMILLYHRAVPPALTPVFL